MQGTWSRRRFALAAIGACALAMRPSPAWALPAPASPTLARLRERGSLRVAMSPGFAPFAVAGDACPGLLDLVLGDKPNPVLASDARPVAGLDVDLATIMAASLGVRLEILLFERLDLAFDALGRSEADVALGGITRTLQRAAALSFSQPYLVSGLQVFTRESATFTTLQSLGVAGVRVGVKAGTTGEEFARKTFPAAAIVPHANNDDLFRALDSGGVDAAVGDSLVGRDMALRKKVGAALRAVENRRFTTESIAMAARQGDADWTAYLSLVVRDLRTDGRFHMLAHRYNPWLRTQR